MPTIIDLKGQTLGRWLVLGQGKKVGTKLYWKVQCMCPDKTINEVSGDSLRLGRSQSCGCLQRERTIEACTTHGASVGRSQPLYLMWKGIHQRCYNKKAKGYENYGGRGIRVCPEWHSFESFRDYMFSLDNCPHNTQIPGASLKLQIDRYPDNDGDYAPGNVRWASPTEQMNNTRVNRIVTINNERMSLTKAVERFGRVSYKTVHQRLSRNWSLRSALLTP